MELLLKGTRLFFSFLSFCSSGCTDLAAACQVQSSQARHQAHMLAALAGEVLTPHKAEAAQVKLTHALQVLILKPWNAAQVQSAKRCKPAGQFRFRSGQGQGQNGKWQRMSKLGQCQKECRGQVNFHNAPRLADVCQLS